MSRSTVLLLVLILSACSGAPTTPSPSPSPTGSSVVDWPLQGPREIVPIAVSSELAIGSNRFLLNLVDNANEPLASADRPVEMRFFDLAADATQPVVTVAGTYLPTIPQLPGLYRAQVDFTRAGEWGLEVVTTEADGSQRSGRMVFSVREASSTPQIGADAPASLTPTAATLAEVGTISTDDDPDPDFYGSSVSDAVAAGQPFLLIFSTPAFCRTATCGPALDIVKSVAPGYLDRVTFIHVEPYQLEMVEGQLQPVLADGQLVPVPSVIEWGLLTEPYIFVVDGAGKVTAKLEGVASAEEIRAALEAVAP